MAEDRIDSLIDEQAIQKEFDFAKNNVKELFALIQQVKQNGMVDMSGVKNLGEFETLKKKVDGLTTSIDKNVQSTKKLTQTHEQVTRETKKLNKEVALKNAQTQEDNKLIRLNAQLENSVKGSMERARIEVQKLTYQRDILNVTTEKGQIKLKELNSQIDAHNLFIQQNLDLDGQRIKNIGNYNGQLGVLSKLLRSFGGLAGKLAESVGLDPASGEIIREVGVGLLKTHQIQQAGNKLTREGAEITRGATISTTANMVATREATVGQKIYASAVGSSTGAMKVFRLALLGLGITALVFGIIELVKYLNAAGDSTNEFGKKAEKAADNQKKFAEQIREVNKALQDQIDFQSDEFNSGVEFTKSQIALAEKSGASQQKILALKKKLAAEENAVADKQLSLQVKRAEQEDINRGDQITGLAALENSIRSHRDNVNFYYGEIIKQQERRNQLLRLGADAEGKEIKVIDKKIEASKAFAETEKAVYEDLYGAARKSFETTNALSEANVDINQERLNMLNEIAKIEFDTAADERKFKFDLLSLQLKDRMDANAAIIANERKSYEERQAASQAFYNDSLALLEAQRDFEITDIDKRKEEDKRQAQFEIKDKGKLNATLQNIDKEADNKKILARGKFNSDILKLNRDNEKQLLELKTKNENDILSHQAAIHENNLSAIKNRYEEDINVENEAYLKKVKAAKGNKDRLEKIEKEHQDFLLGRQLQYNIDALSADIAFTKSLVAQAEIRASLPGATQEEKDAVGKAKAKLAALEIQLQKDVTEYYIEDNKRQTKSDEEKTQKRLELFQKIQDAAKSTFEIIGGFINASVEKENNLIQEQIDLLDKQKEKDIEVANQTIANEQEKAAAIIVIEARAEARKEALERKRRENELRRARFEKAQSIASIILNTAMAVTKFLSKGDIFEAIAAGIIGAGQLAVAIATPLPKYKYGTGDGAHPGGLAEVGEGGKAEAVITPDGKVYKTPAVATVVDLPKGTKVYPDYSQLMLAASVSGTNQLRNQQTIDTSPILKKGFNTLERAIKNKSEVNIVLPSRWKTYMNQGHYFRQYLNDNL